MKTKQLIVTTKLKVDLTMLSQLESQVLMPLSETISFQNFWEKWHNMNKRWLWIKIILTCIATVLLVMSKFYLPQDESSSIIYSCSLGLLVTTFVVDIFTRINANNELKKEKENALGVYVVQMFRPFVDFRNGFYTEQLAKLFPEIKITLPDVVGGNPTVDIGQDSPLHISLLILQEQIGLGKLLLKYNWRLPLYNVKSPNGVIIKELNLNEDGFLVLTLEGDRIRFSIPVDYNLVSDLHFKD